MKKIAGIFSLSLSLMFLGLLLTAPASAAILTLDVNNLSDAPDATPGDGVCEATTGPVCTLRAAIMEANSNPGVDTINLTPGAVYSLNLAGSGEDSAATGDLDIIDGVIINGNGAAIEVNDGATFTAALAEYNTPTSITNPVTIKDRALHIIIASSDSSVTINDLTIRYGWLEANGNGGGIYNANGTVTLNRCTIEDNAVINPGATPSVGLGKGGGIYNAGKLTINATVVQYNTANAQIVYGNNGGGGIYNEGDFTANASSIRNNEGYPMGGGLFNLATQGQATPSPLKLFNSTISNNQSISRAGSGCPATATRPCYGNGGGIVNMYGLVSIDGSTLAANTGTQGGGLYNGGGTALVSRSLIENNSSRSESLTSTAGGDGGGLYNLGTLDVKQTTVKDNDARYRGGGINNWAGGSLTVINSTITGNIAASGNGGGIYNKRYATIVNSTLYDNSATLGTGHEFYACEEEDNANACLNNATKLRSEFANTILANSTSPGVCGGELTATTMLSLGGNLESAASCALAGLTNQTPAAVLGALTSIVSSTIVGSYYPLVPSSSPAINAGNNAYCPSDDQRNYKRRDDNLACDIGAYEESNTAMPSGGTDLKLAMTSTLTKGNQQYQLSLTYTMFNQGPLAASGIELKATLSSDVHVVNVSGPGCPSNSQVIGTDGVVTITCTLPSLAAYQSTPVYVLTQPKVFNQNVINSGLVSASTPDPYTPNNSASLVSEISDAALSGSSGNTGTNFGGSFRSGGGALGPLPLFVLGAWAVYWHSRRRRIRPGVI